uniref:Uncharacterized protein n=1 Tax=Moniliophthora roreri TaxID=221103 RepID=A0A0W0GFR6_MONRR
MNPFQMGRTSPPTSPPSSTNKNNTDEDSEERLSSLAASSFSSAVRDYVLYPPPWSTLHQVPEERESPQRLDRTNLSTPLSQRACEPLLPLEPSPTRLNEHDYSLTPPSQPLPQQCQNPRITLTNPQITPLSPTTPPIMNYDSPPITSLPPPLYHLNRVTMNEEISVWDVKGSDDEDNEMEPESRSRIPTLHTTVWMEEVYEQLSALCVNWRDAALSTVGITLAQSVPIVHLNISLETAMTEEGLNELCNDTIPSVIQLLMTILQTISRGTTRPMETENPEEPNEDPSEESDDEAPNAPIVIDLGEEEGPRYFFVITRLPFFKGEWLHMGQPITSVDTQT